MPSLRSRMFRFFVKYIMSPAFSATVTVSQQRKALERFSHFSALPGKTEIEPVQIGDIAAEWISVATIPEACAILYLHGGAYSIGSLNTHRALAARISQASHIKTLLIDYRLAPEHPYPAAVEDSLCAYRWLLDNGYSSNKIVIAGDSAGGGLALATLIMLRDREEPLPAATVCISAWTDLALTGDSMKSRIHKDPLLTRAWLESMAEHYAADNDIHLPCISPLNADLANLPPLLIQVGSDELLLSDSLRLAERARNAGIDVTLDIWDDMWHVWHFFAGFMPEATHAMNRIRNHIHKHLDNLTDASVLDAIHYSFD